jgi:hypothetical protein
MHREVEVAARIGAADRCPLRMKSGIDSSVMLDISS